jgi:arylformamidase
VSEKIFLDYDQEQLNHQYDNPAWAPNMAEVVGRYGTLSAHAYDRLEVQRDVRYDTAPGALVDIFPAAEPGSPVFVFIHGGQWKKLSKEQSAFAAEPFVAEGAAWVAVGFDMIPHVTLDEIVRQNREAVAWVRRNAASMNGDPEKIFVGGHSSGGHLAAMMATTDWKATNGLSHSPVAGAMCVSGNYDLRPLNLSHRGGYLKLDAAGVIRNSPIEQLSHLSCPLIVAAGDGETDEFRRQARAFAEAVTAAGGACDYFEIVDRNHFECIFDMRDPDTRLGAAVRRLIGL